MWRVVCPTSSVAAVSGDGVWLTSTLVSLLVVLALGLLATLFIYAARYFRWLTHAEQLQLARKFRVAFGALFLTAALVPYLVAKAPLLAVTSMSLAVLALIPILLTRPDLESNPNDDTLTPEG